MGSIRGTTLLELIIAVFMVGTMVAALSLLFPKSAANTTTTRRGWLAGNFAATRMQELKQQPYALLRPTPYNNAYFTSFAQAPTPPPQGCDCRAVTNWTALPKPEPGSPPGSPPPAGPDAIYTEDAITYTRSVCINLVNQNGATWDSFCPDPLSSNDLGLKNIHVHVSWQSGPNTNVTDTESLVTR